MVFLSARHVGFYLPCNVTLLAGNILTVSADTLPGAATPLRDSMMHSPQAARFFSSQLLDRRHQEMEPGIFLSHVPLASAHGYSNNSAGTPQIPASRMGERLTSAVPPDRDTMALPIQEGDGHGYLLTPDATGHVHQMLIAPYWCSDCPASSRGWQ